MDFHSEKKLQEAEFFLGKIYEATEDEILYYVSAFLSAWRSVFDFLLYDAAIFFELGFNRNEDMRPWHFRWAAKRLENVQALKFLSWWDSNLSNLRKDPVFEQRSIIIHRGIPEIPSGTITIEVLPGSTTAYTYYESYEKDYIKNDFYPLEHDVTFSTYEQALDKMQSILLEAKKHLN